MPRRFPLSTLVLRAQQRADMENSGLVGPVEWKAILSSAYAELYACVAESGLRYFETKATITTDGGESYDEPAAHLSTVGVDYIDAAGQRSELLELMAQERTLASHLTGDRARCWSLIDDQLWLFPRPPAGQTYEWVYIPQPPDLADFLDADQVDVVTPDGESFLYWAAAVIALAKEESDVSLARAEREAARERIYSWAVLRALHNSRRRMVDRDDEWLRDPADWRY